MADVVKGVAGDGSNDLGCQSILSRKYTLRLDGFPCLNPESPKLTREGLVIVVASSVTH